MLYLLPRHAAINLPDGNLCLPRDSKYDRRSYAAKIQLGPFSDFEGFSAAWKIAAAPEWRLGLFEDHLFIAGRAGWRLKISAEGVL
jgi:hypothetical protein